MIAWSRNIHKTSKVSNVAKTGIASCLEDELDEYTAARSHKASEAGY